MTAHQPTDLHVEEQTRFPFLLSDDEWSRQFLLFDNEITDHVDSAHNVDHDVAIESGNRKKTGCPRLYVEHKVS